MRSTVAFLQQREELGAIFVDDAYGEETLPLSAVRLEKAARRNPGIMVSYVFDENPVVLGRGAGDRSTISLRRKGNSSSR